MYRPPDSKIEYNDIFEDFIDIVLNEEKEFILLGDFNKNMLNNDTDSEWGNFTTSLGLTQLISEPTRVTNDSKTLIDHIYTNNANSIQSVNVEKICLSDHYYMVPWEIIENFDTVDDMVSVWTLLFTEVIDKHAPIKYHRIKRKCQPRWLTSEILDLMKERNKHKLNDNTDAYKALRNKVSALIDIANLKKETYRNKIEEGKSNPRTIWKLFKEFGLKI